MDSPVPVFFIVVLSYFNAWFWGKRFHLERSSYNFQAVNGLRGFLAIFVMLHHALIWHRFCTVLRWEHPQSFLYWHLGTSSVSLFFMISAFLFISKLLDKRNIDFDWLQLYTSRIFRLIPLYLTTVAFMLLIIGYLSDFTLKEPFITVVIETVKWVLFGLWGFPDINQVWSSSSINAKVAGTLTYEWFFYFFLPIPAILITKRPPSIYILLGFMSVLTFLVWPLRIAELLIPFLYGASVSFLVRVPRIKRALRGTTGGVLAFALLFILIIGHNVPISQPSFLLLGIVFLIVASGNSFFGLLTSYATSVLGDISYSVYLLHGILLTIAIRAILGFDLVAGLNIYQYWALVALVSMVLIPLCLTTYCYIEKPCILTAKKILRIYRSRNYYRQGDIDISRRA